MSESRGRSSHTEQTWTLTGAHVDWGTAELGKGAGTYNATKKTGVVTLTKWETPIKRPAELVGKKIDVAAKFVSLAGTTETFKEKVTVTKVDNLKIEFKA